MSDDPNLRLLIKEVNDAARELREGIERRQKEMDRVALAVGALLVAAIIVRCWLGA